MRIPEPLLEEMDRICKAEHRTRSELMLEVMRKKIEEFNQLEQQAGWERLVELKEKSDGKG